jgi:hypothetical protein
VCRLSDKREAPLRSSADLGSLGSALSGAQGPDTAVVLAGHQAVERDRFRRNPKRYKLWTQFSSGNLFLFCFRFAFGWSSCGLRKFFLCVRVFVFVCGVCFSAGFDGQFLRIRLRFVKQKDK